MIDILRPGCKSFLRENRCLHDNILHHVMIFDPLIGWQWLDRMAAHLSRVCTSCLISLFLGSHLWVILVQNRSVKSKHLWLVVKQVLSCICSCCPAALWDVSHVAPLSSSHAWRVKCLELLDLLLAGVLLLIEKNVLLGSHSLMVLQNGCLSPFLCLWIVPQIGDIHVSCGAVRLESTVKTGFPIAEDMTFAWLIIRDVQSLLFLVGDWRVRHILPVWADFFRKPNILGHLGRAPLPRFNLFVTTEVWKYHGSISLCWRCGSLFICLLIFVNCSEGWYVLKTWLGRLATQEILIYHPDCTINNLVIVLLEGYSFSTRNWRDILVRPWPGLSTLR